MMASPKHKSESEHLSDHKPGTPPSADDLSADVAAGAENTLTGGFPSVELPGVSPGTPPNIALASVRKKIATDMADAFTSLGIGEQAALQGAVLDHLAAVEDRQLLNFLSRLLRPTEAWGYRERDPVAASLCRLAVPMLLSEESTVAGSEHLSVLQNRPGIFLGNHLSRFDPHALENALLRSGAEDAANHLP